jgi:hypothetical protein
LPHIPWQYLPDGKQYINAGPDYPGLDREVWSSDPFPARLGLQRHLLQVGYADRLLGRLIARLRETGQFDRSMIVITADHGVSYRPGKPRRAPTRDTISDIAAVPLLIKYPAEQRGRVDDSMVRTIDIVPTIADRLGAKLPWQADGRPIRPRRPASEVVVGIGATGRDVRVPFDRFVEQRKAGLARLVFLFGADDGGQRLYANGPDWDLLGTPEERLPKDPSTGARVELDSVQQLSHYNPAAHVAPSFISGRIVGGVRPGASLAVAVNGKIASITQSFQAGADLRVAAIVPPSAFRAGSNSLDVFAIEGAGRARRLAPLGAVRPERYRLVENDGETVIEGAGRRVTVEKGALDGFVDSHGVDDQGARMSGWAVDPEGPEPVDRVLLFDGDRLVAQARPAVARPDIVERYNAPELKLSGFELRGSTPGADQSDLHVFAIHGDKASELQLWNG